MAHLLEQLGDERFAALISSDNTGKVKDFCDQLLKNALPTEMTICGRTYEILSFLKGNEKSVVGFVMVDRAKEMDANLGKEDGEHILKHQDKIPVSLREEVALVFPDWRHPDNHENAYYIYWSGSEWIRFWSYLAFDHWSGSTCLLRLKYLCPS